MDRITAIRKSLTGFVCGLLGLVPVVGLPPALYALVCWFSVQSRYGKQWNPAAPYLRLGAALGLLGLLGWGLLVAAVVFSVSGQLLDW